MHFEFPASFPFLQMEISYWDIGFNKIHYSFEGRCQMALPSFRELFPAFFSIPFLKSCYFTNSFCAAKSRSRRISFSLYGVPSG